MGLSNPKLKYGFSLLEVMVTLAIVAILAVVSIPMIRSLLLDGRIKAAAETFVQQVQVARSEAIQRQQDVYLSLQSGSNWCYGINAAAACTCSPNDCGLGSVGYSDYTSVTTSTTGFSGGSIYFDGNRGVANEASSVTFAIGSKNMRVSISRLGQISICSTNITGYATC